MLIFLKYFVGFIFILQFIPLVKAETHQDLLDKLTSSVVDLGSTEYLVTSQITITEKKQIYGGIIRFDSDSFNAFYLGLGADVSFVNTTFIGSGTLDKSINTYSAIENPLGAITVEGCVFDSVGASIDSHSGSKSTRVLDCEIRNWGSVALFPGPNSFVWRNKFVSADSGNFSRAIYVTTGKDDIDIGWNFINGYGTSGEKPAFGIHGCCDVSNVFFHHNTVINKTGLGGPCIAIAPQGDFSKIWILNNNLDAGNNSEGIQLDSWYGANLSDVWIDGNFIKGSNGIKISIRDSSAHEAILISQNIIHPVYSGIVVYGGEHVDIIQNRQLGGYSFTRFLILQGASDNFKIKDNEGIGLLDIFIKIDDGVTVTNLIDEGNRIR